MTRVSVTVNGTSHTDEVEPRLLLVHYLRDTLGLTGTHVGCDTSNCGACTVHLDGEAVKSCTVLAVQADGAAVTTIEGMGQEGALHPLQQAFWENHGLQCGYCTPGMIMAAAGPAEPQRRPERERGPRGARGQPVPLHGLPQHRQGGAGGGRRDARARSRAHARGGDGLMGAPGVEAAERTEPGGNGYVGRSLKRKEDPRLITGRATYVDDMVLPGMLYAAIVRSPEAHARIVSIDTSAAREHPAAEAVFTGEDLADMAAPCPMVWVPPGVEIRVPDHWPLAREKVGYVGQAVAVVLGPDRYGVVDAAEQVLVEYDPLPVVVDPEQALEDGAPLVHEEYGTNKVFEWSLAGGDVEGAFRDADVVVEKRIVNHRTAGAAIEPRGVLAEWREGKLTLWSSTQIPHICRVILSIQLGITEEKIRVVAPEVGGGFGSKLQVYGEEVLACWCARRVGRPVKWTATRSEDMLTTHHGRDQIDYVRIGAKRDGTVTGIHARIIQDCGSYHLIEGPVIPTFSACVISGCYDFPAVQTDIVGVFTNKFTTDAIRGAGRPEATHLIELTMDALADELGHGPPRAAAQELHQGVPERRARTASSTTRATTTARSTRCLEMLDLDGFRREQAELREPRRLPRRRLLDLRRDLRPRARRAPLGPNGWGMQGGYFESAQVRVHPTGSVTVYTGTSPHGQGHETGVRADRRRPPRGRRPTSSR